MVDSQSRRINFFRQQHMWDRTMFITGLPRSGKSTLFSLVASCDSVQAIDEPFDITIVCAKSASYRSNTESYKGLQDVYLTLMEHAFTESVMGRNYNFRKHDRSYIYNFKSAEFVEFSQSIQRRRDYMHHVSNMQYCFVLALNDIQESLDFVSSNIPQPKLVFIEKKLIDCAREIEDKGWLSNENLSSFGDLTPAFSEAIVWKKQRMFVPYLIPDEKKEKFLELDLKHRSIVYAALQLDKYRKGLESFNGKVITITSDILQSNPERIINRLCLEFNINRTTLTNRNAQEIHKRVSIPDVKVKLDMKKIEKIFASWNLGKDLLEVRTINE